jgi:hypothetical protein
VLEGSSVEQYLPHLLERSERGEWPLAGPLDEQPAWFVDLSYLFAAARGRLISAARAAASSK